MKILVDMPEGFKLNKCVGCPWDKTCMSNAYSCPLSKAVEAVEVKRDNDVLQIHNHHVEAGTWVGGTFVDNKPVTLYAVRKQEGK